MSSAVQAARYPMSQSDDVMTAEYPESYPQARDRFRAKIEKLGWNLYRYPLKAAAPSGDELSIDVAVFDANNSDRALVISSGMHGVEGPVGSAVQSALLDDYAHHKIDLRSTRVVLIHAVNPFGFAWRRRFNEDNVDLNRNLLLADQLFSGSPERYAELHGHLNPPGRLSRWEPTTLKMLAGIARYGMPTLRQTIAGGQYDYPRGLYYGGTAPTESHEVLAAHFDGWLGTCRRVVHFDVHTGLGPWATCKLLIDYELDESRRSRLCRWFGTNSFEEMSSGGMSFTTRGSLGSWTTARYRHRDYHYASAEFGTYRPSRIFYGLRAENQAHHWGRPAELEHAKRRLTELFCPRSPRWRQSVLAIGRRLIDQALAGLHEPDAEDFV